MHKRFPFVTALLVFASLAGAPNLARADLLEDHARLMEGAIAADDGDQINKLMATPYVNANGFRYRNGRSVIWLNQAAANGKLAAADAILDAKPSRAKILTYAESGQRWVPANWLMVGLHAERGEVLKEFDYVMVINRTLKAGLGPDDSDERREFATYWLQLYTEGNNGSIDQRAADSLQSGLEHFKLGFAQLIPHATWAMVLPVSASNRFADVLKVVKDFRLIDRNGNTVLNELLLVEHPMRLDWLNKILAINPKPPLDHANAAGFYPADFIWFHAPNSNGRLCMASTNLINTKPAKKQRHDLLRTHYGDPIAWPRKGFASCNDKGHCNDCLGPGA